VRTDLSIQAKQSFQVVALLATILVVGIHYKSDIPDFPSPRDATWNQLGQEFLFGTLARVAVPLFALAAGLFYFRSDDGSLASYRRKLTQRARTVALPYFIIASLAFAFWLFADWLTGRQFELSLTNLVGHWLLHPPAEQLWFLRDLMVLVVIAPVIRWLCNSNRKRGVTLTVLLIAWIANLQPFPILAGWYLINIETLLFFTIGCAANDHLRWIEGFARVSPMTIVATVSLWCMLAATRITVKADFDLWYVGNYGPADLMLHQASILVGCVALFMIAARLRHPALIRLSGASFFVYLIHEYPLRAIMRSGADKVSDHDTSSWLVTPLVIVGCYTVAVWLDRRGPALFSLLAGGRSPSQSLSRRELDSPSFWEDQERGTSFRGGSVSNADPSPAAPTLPEGG